MTSILNKKADIIEYLNSKFNKGYYNIEHIEWKTKSILTSSRENYLNERFADLDFTVKQVIFLVKKSSNCNEGLEKLKTILITFNKTDIGSVVNKLSSLNENLKTIKKMMNNNSTIN